MRKLGFGMLLASYFLAACNSSDEKTNQSTEPTIDFLETGKEITAVAQAELLKNVKNALEKEGPVYAIEFCNIHAESIADSISKKFDVQIQRLSLKNRNPENGPSTKEDKLLLNDYLEKLNEGRSITDTLIRLNGISSYYRPIIISAETCLKCHGQPGQEINNETMVALNKLYPEDRATNYRMGELRGMWKITFSAKSH
jgi:hypothetical protein